MHYLAKRQNRPAYSYEIAGAENIPLHFLEKILTELSHAGLLQLVKGRKGGYFIPTDLQKVTMTAILQVVQGPLIASPCVDRNKDHKCDECLHKDICAIRETFSEIVDESIAILSRINLETLIQQNGTTN